jgi:hypothetical protein
MAKHIVRKNCEYSMAIEAESAEEAIQIADKIPDNEWNQSWSALEVEEEE